MRDTTNKLGNFIKSQRLRLAQSQGALAHAAGLNQSVLSRIENGEIKAPTVVTLAKLAKALNLPHEDILNLMKSPPPALSPSVNFHPLIVALANREHAELYLEDLELLIEVQKLLREPMTPTMVDEVLKMRRKKVETSN